eukprot:s1851_g5.t1
MAELLCRRLRALHIPCENTTKLSDEYGHLSIDQLWKTKLGFGSTHENKTYGEIWQNHQKYVVRFLQHHGASQRPQHRQFLYFLECMIEQSELRGVGVPLADHANPSAVSSPGVTIGFPPDKDTASDDLTEKVMKLEARVKSLEEKMMASESTTA